MIRSESDYQEALRRANQDREIGARQRAVFASAG